MEILRQKCQQCGELSLRILLVNEHQVAPERAYVQCIQCGALVAVYDLAHYYNNQDGIESYLKSQGASDDESGRGWLADFRLQHEQAEQAFRRILETLKEAEDQSENL